MVDTLDSLRETRARLQLKDIEAAMPPAVVVVPAPARGWKLTVERDAEKLIAVVVATPFDLETIA